MSTLAPPITDAVSVRGGERLFFGQWPGPAPTLVCLHGLTSTHRNIAAVARALDGALDVVAPDLLGRGVSSRLPAGSYGMEAHARDVLALMDALEIDRAIVGGHSMGAYVATAVAVAAPDRVAGLALIDGGVYYLPPGTPPVDPDQMLETVLKPVIDRTRRTFASVDEYREFWRAMPYFPKWGPIVEDYLVYDLGRRGNAFGSKCSEAAAAEDWRDLLTNLEIVSRLDRVRCPVLAVGAEFGLTTEQPAVLSDVPHVERLREAVADVEFVRVAGTTHHTVTLSEEGAAATAEALRKFAARLSG
jgi:pimeloyl-ACP methyl ester carboxylesterase